MTVRLERDLGEGSLGVKIVPIEDIAKVMGLDAEKVDDLSEAAFISSAGTSMRCVRPSLKPHIVAISSTALIGKTSLMKVDSCSLVSSF